jgi:small neutral amino acid transporter SnatA (MarC family)
MNAVSSFAFTISLAAVINGLGIVRLLSTLAEYLRRRDRLEVGHFWVYSLLLLFQFVLHVLFWWAMFGVGSVGGFNFVGYMYLLIGPVCIYLATSLLIPDVDGDSKSVDLRAQYFRLAPSHFTVIAVMWFHAGGYWQPGRDSSVQQE